MKVSKNVARLYEHLSSYSPDYARWLQRRSDYTSFEFPKYRSESWKYTNPDGLLEAQTESSSTSQLHIHGPVNIYDFEDIKIRPLVQDRLGQLTDNLSLAELNKELLDHGLVIESKNSAGVVEIESLPGNYQRLIVIANVDLEIVETAPCNNRIVECWVGSKALLKYRRLQSASQGHEYNGFAAHVEPEGQLHLEQYSNGSKLRRNEFDISLNGKSAEVHITGAWRLAGNQHIDNQISINHIEPGGLSRQHMRGQIMDQAKSIFNGRIYIAKGADGSDAELNNRNLIESPTAEVYAKPELEIYAQDVSCSHGATVGEIDREALFYLQSRGISEQAARQLLVRGFLSPAINHPDGRDLLDVSPDLKIPGRI